MRKIVRKSVCVCVRERERERERERVTERDGGDGRVENSKKISITVGFILNVNVCEPLHQSHPKNRFLKGWEVGETRCDHLTTKVFLFIHEKRNNSVT